MTIYSAYFDGSFCTIYNLPHYLIEELTLLLKLDIELDFYKSIKSKSSCPISLPFIDSPSLIRINNSDVSFLSGLIAKVHNYLWSKHNINLSYQPLYLNFDYPSLHLSAFLYTHQISIVNTATKYKRGIIQSPTASGKTVSIAELCRIFIQTGKVLITVPTITLLYQMKHDIEAFCHLGNYPVFDIGLIGDGNLNLDKSLTIAIPDTLINRIDSSDPSVLHFLNTRNVLIADECHYCPTPTYLQLIQYMKSRRISLGFSATPWSNLGANLILEGMFGPKIINITESDMIQKGVIMQPKFEFHTAPKISLPPKLLSQDYSHWVYNQLYNLAITTNKSRNNLITKLVSDYINTQQGPILIIVNKVGTTGKSKVSHAQILYDLLLNQGFVLPILHGQISSKQQDEVLSLIKDYKIPGIIGSAKLLTAGVNIKNLSALCIAGGGRSDKNQIQQVGRILRTNLGKSQPIVFDIVDTQSYFAGQSQFRINTAIDIYGSDCVTII